MATVFRIFGGRVQILIFGTTLFHLVTQCRLIIILQRRETDIIGMIVVAAVAMSIRLQTRESSQVQLQSSRLIALNFLETQLTICKGIKIMLNDME